MSPHEPTPDPVPAHQQAERYERALERMEELIAGLPEPAPFYRAFAAAIKAATDLESLRAPSARAELEQRRVWAMPSPNTFSIPPIADLLARWIPVGCVVVDPFARATTIATITNDIDPSAPSMYHMEASEFLARMATDKVVADVVLFDPPYSPRQISECYKQHGLKVGMQETQNGRLYKTVRDGLNALLRPGGVAISCGWNSGGFGVSRGYILREILLVAHGGAHNDTIVVVETKACDRQLPLAALAAGEQK